MPSRRTFLLSLSAAGTAAAFQTPTSRPSTVSGELQPIPLGQVRLLPGPFLDRAKLNRDYVVSLQDDNLLQNFYLEAGLWNPRFRMTAMGEASRGDDIHWGWESPTCQLKATSSGTGCLPRPTSPHPRTTGGERQGRSHYFRVGACAEGKRRRVGRVHPREILRLAGAQQACLGAALHGSQDLDGPD